MSSVLLMALGPSLTKAAGPQTIAVPEPGQAYRVRGIVDDPFVPVPNLIIALRFICSLVSPFVLLRRQRAVDVRIS
ncbi:hypothetical protein LX36DRAFT_331649 [Colletotrichum falcatum]|nr:hypothetical protein LX36DRAFT_331649 [Colletotrichum falcatum]